MNPQIEQILEEATESLHDAEALLTMKRYKAVVSRSYYVMYHTTKAVLASINVETFTHQGVNTQFTKHFIRTGIFDKSVIKAFSKMLEKRTKADYEIGFRAEEDDAIFALSEATLYYNTINEYITKTMVD